MSQQILDDLLQGKYFSTKENRNIYIPIEKVVIASQAIDEMILFIDNIKSSKKVLIVSDENTHLAAGAEVERKLCHKKEITSLILPSDISADDKNSKILRSYAIDVDLIVAVGGGTISDLCKYTAFLLNKEYICLATCASVNGFSSANASITVDGVKKSLSAKLPKAVFMDIDVIITSPRRLTLSGLGDSLARSTAQVDWLLSHYLLGTYYNQDAFDILYEDEKKLLENPEKLFLKDYDSLITLCRLLILSGIGMYIAGSSAPASQAEHLVAHYMDMKFSDSYQYFYHGEVIAVTTNTISKIQEDILSHEALRINPLYYSEKPIMLKFGQKGKELLATLKNKEINEQKAIAVNEMLTKDWQKIKEHINQHRISAEQIENIIKNINGPYTYKHLGWSYEHYNEAINNSAFLRDRFTILDLAMCKIDEHKA